MRITSAAGFGEVIRAKGLLPEGFTRRSVAQWLHLDENDYLSILHQLGRECLGAAGISPRECTRCFQRSINRPPIRFLIEYRAQMAAMRLERTDDSISSIAEQCGFVSDSCFGKTFKDIYGCPPRDYWKKHRA